MAGSLKLFGKILLLRAGQNAVLQPLKLLFPLVGADIFDVLCIVHCRVRDATADLAQSVNRNKAVGCGLKIMAGGAKKGKRLRDACSDG